MMFTHQIPMKNRKRCRFTKIRPASREVLVHGTADPFRTANREPWTRSRDRIWNLQSRTTGRKSHLKTKIPVPGAKIHLSDPVTHRYHIRLIALFRSIIKMHIYNSDYQEVHFHQRKQHVNLETRTKSKILCVQDSIPFPIDFCTK